MANEENKIELLTTETKAEIDKWLAKFPDERRLSAVIPALHIAQEQNEGWLSEDIMDAVADYLNIPPIAAYEVATFYNMYDLKPVGRHKIGLCCSISCVLQGAGAKKIGEHLKERLGVGFGETTKDGKFTLKHAECLGACRGGPVMLLDKDYHEDLTPEKVDAILESVE